MAEQEAKQEDQIKFYSNKICPFGHRAWLTLEVKKIPYEFIRCDLKEKQAFFTEVYQKALGANEGSDGKVPIILHNGKYICESAIVARYLDYVFCDEDKYGPSLLPKDAFQRAAVEIMIDWFGGSGWIRSHYGLLMNANPDDTAKGVTEWKKKWKILDERLKQFTEKGLFLPDGRVSLFEIIAFPFFERLCVIQTYCEQEIYSKWMDEFPRVKSWYETAKENEGIKKCLQDPKFFVDGYKGYREKALANYEKFKKEQAEKQNK